MILSIIVPRTVIKYLLVFLSDLRIVGNICCSSFCPIKTAEDHTDLPLLVSPIFVNGCELNLLRDERERERIHAKKIVCLSVWYSSNRYDLLRHQLRTR